MLSMRPSPADLLERGPLRKNTCSTLEGQAGGPREDRPPPARTGFRQLLASPPSAAFHDCGIGEKRLVYRPHVDVPAFALRRLRPG
jgi:hypothetical protein